MDRSNNGLFTENDEDYKLAQSLGLTIADILESRQAEARRAFEATLAPKQSPRPSHSPSSNDDSSTASELNEKEEKELVELSRDFNMPVHVLREGRAAEKERQAAQGFNHRYNQQKAKQALIKGPVMDEEDQSGGEGTRRVKKAKTTHYSRPTAPRDPTTSFNTTQYSRPTAPRNSTTSFNTRGLPIIPEEAIEEGEPEEGYNLYKILVRPLVPRPQTLEDIRGVLHRNGQRIIRRLGGRGYVFSIQPEIDVPFQGKFWDDRIAVVSMEVEDLEEMKRKTLE